MKQRSKISIGLIALLITGLIAAVTILFMDKTALDNSLKQEKILSEKLLSEKLLLSKEIEKTKEALVSLKSDNVKLNLLLINANESLTLKEAELKKVRANNNKNLNTIKSLKKQLNELAKIKEGYNAEISALQNEIKKLKLSNTELNSRIAALLEENAALKKENELLKRRSTNNVVVATHGKKNKPVKKASKADMISISFDVAQEISNNPFLEMRSPKGDIYTSKKDLVIVVKKAALSGKDSFSPSGQSINTQRVTVSFKPIKKMGAGTYSFNLYDKDVFVGSTVLTFQK